jgi:antitoxin MazE
MRVHAKIQKWGNGLALRVSGVMRDIPHFQEGTEVDVDVTEKGFFVIKSEPKKKSLFPFTESQLIKALNDGQDRAHLLATPLKSETE